MGGTTIVIYGKKKSQVRARLNEAVKQAQKEWNLLDTRAFEIKKITADREDVEFAAEDGVKVRVGESLYVGVAWVHS